MSSSSAANAEPTSERPSASRTTSSSAPFDGGADFEWHKYLAHRPTYSPAFYDIIWEYHQNHSSHWQLAHDVGTGPGNVAEVLAARFDRVIASDPSGHNVAVAGKRLNHSKISFEICRAEDLPDIGGTDSEDKADLIALAECIPLMDAEKAFDGFARMMRPGGTLAVWFYGKPIFGEPGQEKSQAIYDRITAKAFERLFPLKGTPGERGITTLATWLDDIAFPASEWTDVKRIKWNNDKPLTFIGEEYFDFKFQYKSSVGPHEILEEKMDRTFWAKEKCGIEWAKEFIDAQFPWKNETDDIDAQLIPMFEDLEAAMGGKGSKVRISWPVVLLLATRK